jgi:hypothetical protein
LILEAINELISFFSVAKPSVLQQQQTEGAKTAIPGGGGSTRPGSTWEPGASESTRRVGREKILKMTGLPCFTDDNATFFSVTCGEKTMTEEMLYGEKCTIPYCEPICGC